MSHRSSPWKWGKTCCLLLQHRSVGIVESTLLLRMVLTVTVLPMMMSVCQSINILSERHNQLVKQRCANMQEANSIGTRILIVDAIFQDNNPLIHVPSWQMPGLKIIVASVARLMPSTNSSNFKRSMCGKIPCNQPVLWLLNGDCVNRCHANYLKLRLCQSLSYKLPGTWYIRVLPILVWRLCRMDHLYRIARNRRSEVLNRQPNLPE